MNAAASDTVTCTAPSSTVGSKWNALRIAAAAASASPAVTVTTSPPTIAFSSAGVPRATMVPASMMAMRSQYSASSM